MALTLDVNANTRDAERNLSKLGTTMAVGVAAAAAAAAAAIAGVTAAAVKVAQEVASTGDQLQKMSLRTGIGTEELSRLSFAAQLAGTDIVGMEMGIRRAQKAMLESEQGSTTYKRAFDALGISVRNTDGSFKSVSDLLPEVADALQNLGSETERAALLQQIFGRTGTNLLPLLRQGSKGLREQYKEAERLGIVYSEVAAQQAADFVDAQTRLGGALQGVKRAFAEEIIPALTVFANSFAMAFSSMQGNAQTFGQFMAGVLANMVIAFGKAWGGIVGMVDAARTSWIGAEIMLLKLEKAALEFHTGLAEIGNTFTDNTEQIEENRAEMDRLNASLVDAAFRQMNAKNAAGEHSKAADALGAEIVALGESLRDGNYEVTTAADLMGDAADAAGDFDDAVKDLTVNTGKVSGASDKVSDAFGKNFTPNVSKASETVRRISSEFDALDAKLSVSKDAVQKQLGKIAEEFGGNDGSGGWAGTVVGYVRGAVDLIAEMFGVDIPRYVNAAINALQNLASGNVAGAVMSAIAAIGGALKSLFGERDSVEKRIQQATRDLAYLGNVSEDVAKKVGELAFELRHLNDYGVNPNMAAQFLLMGEIIRDTGIPNAQAFAQAVNTLTAGIDLMVDGMIDWNEGLSALNDAVPEIVANMGVMGEVGRQAFRGFVEAVREAGIEIEALNQHFVTQAGLIASALDPMLARIEDRLQHLRERAEAMGARFVEQFALGRRATSELRFAVDALNLSVIEMVAQGISWDTILETVGSTVQRLVDLANTAGIKLPDTLQEIADLMDIVSNQKIKSMLDNLGLMTQVFDAIRNQGLKPTAAMFDAFALNVKKTLKEFQEAGASAEQVLIALGPALSILVGSGAKIPLQIKKLLAEFGIELDQFKPETDYLEDLNAIADRQLTNLLAIKEHVRDTARYLKQLGGFQTAPGEYKTVPGAMNEPRLIVAHGREIIGRPAMVGGGGGGPVSVTIHVNGATDPRATAEEVARVLQRELENQRRIA